MKSEWLPSFEFFLLTTCCRPQHVRIEEATNVRTSHLHESAGGPDHVARVRHNPCKSLSTNMRSSDRPLSQWDCLSPRNVPAGMRMRQDSVGNKTTLSQTGTGELSGFQRFIRRMDSASSKIILDRIKEDWSAGGDVDEEVSFSY